jgi:hypothetical protein
LGINKNNFRPRILYPAKLSFKIDGAIKIFHNKKKLKLYMTTKSLLQKILQGIFHTKEESKKKPREDEKYQTTGEEKTSNQRVALIQLHTIKSLNKKNNYMAGITTYLSILTLNANGFNSPIKRHHLANWIKKEDLIICCLQETHLIERNKHWFRVKRWKKIYEDNGPRKQAGVAILTSDKVDFKLTLIK